MAELGVKGAVFLGYITNLNISSFSYDLIYITRTYN